MFKPTYFWYHYFPKLDQTVIAACRKEIILGISHGLMWYRVEVLRKVTVLDTQIMCNILYVNVIVGDSPQPEIAIAAGSCYYVAITGEACRCYRIRVPLECAWNKNKNQHVLGTLEKAYALWSPVLALQTYAFSSSPTVTSNSPSGENLQSLIASSFCVISSFLIPV